VAKSPDAFRTISEVAAQLDTPAHVLRFWESKFPQIRPVKRAGGRRYYRPDDIALVAGIKLLLHDQGMTIRGVQKLLRERGARHVATLSSLPWEGVDATDEDMVSEDATGGAVPEAVGKDAGVALDPVAEAHADVETAMALDATVPDPVVVGPWPGAGGEGIVTEVPAPASERPTIIETFVAGVATRLAASRDETLAEPSVARLREVLGTADRTRLCGEAARLRPLVERLRALRDGSPAQPG
jgi:DNA-binding transcriptional MerR regulator